MATPPPRASRARTPPTPLHGPQYDNYEPYSPRRSTRTTAHNNPYSSFKGQRSPKAQSTGTPPPTIQPPTIKKTRFASVPTQLSSPPSSPTSPARHRTPRSIHKTPRKDPFSSQRRTTTAANGTLSDSDGLSNSFAPPTIDPNTMLPTPSKTPKKRQAAVTSTARILNFQPSHPNDVMPSPRQLQKQRRTNNNAMAGFELYDEEAVARNGESIEIYTDASARVPEVDESEENPFVGPRRGRQRPQRKSRKSAAQLEHDAQIDEAARQDEGVVYVFRGKKIFRRFQDDGRSEQASSAGSEVSGTHEQRQLKRQAGAAARRPLTRSTIKPRLLFPSDEQLAEREQGADDVDEEAVTDIEMGDAHDQAQASSSAPAGHTPQKVTQEHMHVKPATPPPTGRATRSKKVSPEKTSPANGLTPEADAMESSFDSAASASVGKKGKAKSPFDSWPRGKPGKRRAGDSLESGGKRSRAAATAESPD